MKIFEFAINLEREHQKFYQEQAEKTAEGKLKKVFIDLAGEEKKHEKIIRELADDEKEKLMQQVDSNILPEVKKTFKEIAKVLVEDSLPQEQLEVYQKAMQMETKAYNFYTEKKDEVSSEKAKDAFAKLAVEEKKHEDILRNLVEMVNRPNTWLDNAEWYHREEY